MKHLKFGWGVLALMTGVGVVVACGSTDSEGDGDTADSGAEPIPTTTSTPTTTTTTTSTPPKTDSGVPGTDAGDAGLTCTGGKTACNGACVDLATDGANCGVCGKACTGTDVCGPSEAGAIAECRATCTGGTSRCGNTCFNLATDLNHCGSCTKVCTLQNAAGASCTGQADGGGACNYTTCNGGFDDCDSNRENGCEANLTSPRTCGSCANDCGAGSTCGAGNVCQAVSCKALHTNNPALPSGKYLVDPDGAGGAAPFEAYCDMTTSGGGWTIISSITGANGEEPLVSDTEVVGNPLAVVMEHSNLNRAKKMALSAISTESLFWRTSAIWLKVDKPLFDANLATATTRQTPQLVNLTTSDAVPVTATAFMGYVNYDISGGGDFGITTRPGGATCSGSSATDGFDQHSSTYRNLNCGCQLSYLYSYSAVNNDGDAGYDVNTGLGAWTATSGCDGNEGGSAKFYAAMR